MFTKLTGEIQSWVSAAAGEAGNPAQLGVAPRAVFSAS